MKTKKLRIFTFFLLIFIYSCSDKTPQDQKKTNKFYDKAFDYRDKGEIDSSFSNFYKAKDLFIQQKDSLGVAKSLVNMAIIQEKYGDNFGSQETGLEAIHFLNKKDSTHKIYISINYNTLGIISSKLKNYKQSIVFYKQALFFADNATDKIIYQNNLATNYRRNSNYKEAVSIYKSILKENPNSQTEYARTTNNLAYAKWLQNPKYDPNPEFQKALQIRLKEKDQWGLNSSYAHIADYYSEKQQDSALIYAKKMYRIAQEIKSPDDQTEALQKLISLEEPEKSKHYFKIYQKLDDSLQTARNKAKNQFALIRYETEKNKADFLKAKNESKQRQNHIIKQYFGLGSLIIALILSYLWFRKRQKTMQQEKLLEVKQTELKYSKKVHDRVANKVYQVMSEVENIKDLDRTTLLDRLEEIYEISRNISYEKEATEPLNFREQLAQMLKSYASDSVKIFITGNEEEIWKKTHQNQQNEVYCILQELMTNMKKHSQADKVFLKFSEQDACVNISYIDNGIGIKIYSPKNGLQNTETRTKAIHGTISFDTETDRLLKINLSFPV